MICKRLKDFLALLLVGLATGQAMAQTTNLIKNPDFEGSKGKNNWYASRALGADVSKKNPHSGEYCLNMYAVSGTLSVADYDDNGLILMCIPVQGGAKYTLKFWYRGQATKETLTPVFRWGTSQENIIKSETLSDHAVKLTKADEWQEKKIEVVAPQGATLLGVNFSVTNDQGQDIFLDDFSLTSEAPKANIGVPSELQAKKTYQRELELTWGEVTGATYELQVGDKTFPSSTNSFLLTGLMPSTNYEVKVRALKDGEQSSWAVASVQTSALTTQVNDEMRTPYLRTIGSDGTCATALQLFYSELHGSDATFAYKINGQTATPKEHILTLPKGRSTLQVEVKEANDRIWLLIYTLDAK